MNRGDFFKGLGFGAGAIAGGIAMGEEGDSVVPQEETLRTGDVILCKFSSPHKYYNSGRVRFMGKQYGNGDYEIFVLQDSYEEQNIVRSHNLPQHTITYAYYGSEPFEQPTLHVLTGGKLMGSMTNDKEFTISWQKIGHTDDVSQFEESKRLTPYLPIHSHT